MKKKMYWKRANR